MLEKEKYAESRLVEHRSFSSCRVVQRWHNRLPTIVKNFATQRLKMKRAVLFFNRLMFWIVPYSSTTKKRVTGRFVSWCSPSRRCSAACTGVVSSYSPVTLDGRAACVGPPTESRCIASLCTGIQRCRRKLRYVDVEKNVGC